MIKKDKINILNMNNLLKENTENKLEINFFIVFLFTFFVSINIFNLSYNLNILSEVHGPFYLDIAKGFHENKFLSNYYNLIPESNIYTFQIGISLIHYIGLIIFGYDYWFLIPILLCSLLWCCCYVFFLKFIKSLKINSKFFLFTCLLCFFLQPYNLNQIATYSNEMIYYPLSIIILLYFYENLTYKNNILLSILLIPVIIFGIFFRFHHLILILSIFFGYLHVKEKKIKIILFFIFFFICNILIISLMLSNDSKSIVNTLYIFINYLTDYFFNENLLNTYNLPGINVSVDNTNYFSLTKINDGLNVFSGHFILNKFISNELSIFILNLVFIPITYQGIKLTNSIFLKKFTSYFIFFSIIFLYVLPPNELNYYLPTSFIVIFSQIFFLKNLLKYQFNKFIIISFTIFFLSVVYLLSGGSFLSDKLEVLKNRDNFNELEQFKINYFNGNNNLVFKTNELTFPSNLSKQLNTKFCNSNIEKCMGIKKQVKYIYLFGRDHGYVNTEFENSKINLLKDINRMNFDYDYTETNTSRYLILRIKLN